MVFFAGWLRGSTVSMWLAGVIGVLLLATVIIKVVALRQIAERQANRPRAILARLDWFRRSRPSGKSKGPGLVVFDQRDLAPLFVLAEVRRQDQAFATCNPASIFIRVCASTGLTRW